MHACMHAYIHTYIHTYVRTYIHTCIHTYIHTYIIPDFKFRKSRERLTIWGLAPMAFCPRLAARSCPLLLLLLV